MTLSSYAQEEEFSEDAPQSAPLLTKLEHYKPIYFLFGNPESKVQFSFKFKILEDQNLFFAYSQLMMWDLWKDSAPIVDTNYNPDIFYRWFASEDKNTWVDFGFWEHESNGQSDPTTRSWDRSYLRYRSVTDLGSHGTKLYWSFKGWISYRDDSENSDINNYRGLWELNLSLANLLSDNFQPDDLTFRLYPGGKSCIDPTAGGQELTLRLRPYFRNFLREAVVQVFHGYGESLLFYDQTRWRLRIGIGF